MIDGATFQILMSIDQSFSSFFAISYDSILTRSYSRVPKGDPTWPTPSYILAVIDRLAKLWPFSGYNTTSPNMDDNEDAHPTILRDCRFDSEFRNDYSRTLCEVLIELEMISLPSM